MHVGQGFGQWATEEVDVDLRLFSQAQEWWKRMIGRQASPIDSDGNARTTTLHAEHATKAAHCRTYIAHTNSGGKIRNEELREGGAGTLRRTGRGCEGLWWMGRRRVSLCIGHRGRRGFLWSCRCAQRMIGSRRATGCIEGVVGNADLLQE